MVENLRTELLRQAADVIEARLHDLLRLVELSLLFRGRGCSESLELEENGGHRLADLVVQAAREALTLRFLCLERVRAGIATLLGEPLEHHVERPFQATDLAWADDRQPLAAAKDVSGLHLLRKPLERKEQPPKEETVDDQHDEEPDQQRGEVDQGRVFVQRTWSEGKRERACDQDGGVGGEDAPEHGHTNLGLTRDRLP